LFPPWTPLTYLVDQRLRTPGVEKKNKILNERKERKRKGNWKRMKRVKNVACRSSIRG
jgi:hypothetical protein